MPSKIPFWRTFGDAFGFVFTDFPRFLRLSAGWIALSTIAFILAIVILGVASVQPERPIGGPMHIDWDRTAAQIVLGLIKYLSDVAFAVAWHRIVLLGEARGVFGLRFRWRELRFLLYSWLVAAIIIAILMAAFLLAFAIGFAALSGGGGGVFGTPWIAAIVFPVSFIVLIACLPLIGRLSLGLPAIAIEEPQGVLRRAWHRGWRNGWRLVRGPILCSIPLAIASGLFSAMQGAMSLLVALDGGWRIGGLIGETIFWGMSVGVHFLAVATGVTFLSLSYRHLSGSAAPGTG